MHEGTPDEARRAYAASVPPTPDDPLASVEDRTIPGPAGPMRLRVYRPEGQGLLPAVVYFHGGGWVMGSIESHNALCHSLASRSGCVVAAVDYRLAPEDPFPAGHLDCVAALRHVVGIIDELGADTSRIAVAGDSAGGNLGAGVAVAARDAGLPLKAQLLLYPSTDFVDSELHASRAENAEGFFLTVEDMLWFHECYAADPGDVRASVLAHPDLTGVAPAVVATAEFDPLRDEGEAYAAALEKAGVPVVVTRYAGLIHGFFGLSHISESAKKASLEICGDLKELLG
jgi:acetyl esterase